MRYFPLAWRAAVGAAFGAAAFFGVVWVAHGSSATLVACAVFGFVVGLFIGLVAMAAMVLFMTVRVSEEGLRAFDFWGRPRELAWSQISKVRPTRLGGLRYLRVFGGTTEGPLWLPLFLQQPQAFWSAVANAAGPHSPLQVRLSPPAA